MVGTLESQKKMRAAKVEKRSIRVAAGLPAAGNPVLAAEEDPVSFRKAINAMCYQCMGGTRLEGADSDWRKAVRDCTAPDCALFILRPHQERPCK